MKQETLEEHFLGKMKEVLLFGNDAQAIRFMEKYFEAKQERSYSEEDIALAFNEEQEYSVNGKLYLDKQQGYSEEELKSAFKIGFNIGYGSPVQELDLKNEHCEKWFKQFKNK